MKRLITLGALAVAAVALSGCVTDGYGRGSTAYWHHNHSRNHGHGHDHDGDGHDWHHD